MRRFTCATQTVLLLYNGSDVALATSKASGDPRTGTGTWSEYYLPVMKI